MLFRALFWIGIVVLFAPHPSALGLGEFRTLEVAHIAFATDARFGHFRADGETFVDTARSDLFRQLRKVRADIEQDDALDHERGQYVRSLF